MHFTKLFVVLTILIEKIHLSTSTIEIDNPDGFAELEESAFQVLTTCYAQRNKTILLIGDYPGNFVHRLMSQHSFSLVLLDDRRRSENNNDDTDKVDQYRKYKVHVVVIIASFYKRSYKMFERYWHSIYDNSLASVLIIGWDLARRHAGCDNRYDSLDMLYDSSVDNMFNTNVMCHDHERGIWMYGYNPFTDQAPVPWRSVECIEIEGKGCFYLFERKYEEHGDMCKNLDFDKTHDLNGQPIKTLHAHRKLIEPTGAPENRLIPNRRLRIQAFKRSHFIENFITYVNATRQYKWKRKVVGEDYTYELHTIDDTPFVMRGEKIWPTFTYPHINDCKFIVTQFRGNKSQLSKLYAVIDSSSWIGMYVVYLLTWIVFKFFLRQPMMVGILNLCRLTCNWGLPALPKNLGSQIYISCLLFFVVTMQGIFAGRLAALLTNDVPFRQVDTFQDLIDFDYTVYVDKFDAIYFNDTVLQTRLRFLKMYEDCINYVVGDSTFACVTSDANPRDRALKAHLYISTGCIVNEYFHNRIPWRWALEERLNNFLLTTLETGTVMPLDILVDEKRMLEAESQQIPRKPKIMNLKNLSFAFIGLGIGLGCASITFILEIMLHRPLSHKCRLNFAES